MNISQEEELWKDRKHHMWFPISFTKYSVTKSALSVQQGFFKTSYDEKDSIGKRYRRQDAIGTPYCITIDFDTENDASVTIRDRDSMQQVRLPISEVAGYLLNKIDESSN